MTIAAEPLGMQPEFAERYGEPISDCRVAVLTNYLRETHVDVYSEVRHRVKDLKVFVSTPMESDRHWQPQWKDLDVVVQRNWTAVRTWRHSSGFAEENFVHFPIDTLKQLRRFKPDIVFSAELGMRTLLCSFFRSNHGHVPLVAIGNMSEAIERERGLGRRLLRGILRRRVDYFTYNGPSCKRYLRSLGVPDNQLFFFPYYYDASKIYRGLKSFEHGGPRRLLFSGNLTARKGISDMVAQLREWAQTNPHRQLELRVCGTGEESSHLKSGIAPNVAVDCRGHCDDEQLADSYAWADICVFPTLADEWGLVPIEAFASGVPVIGSIAAQSIEVYGQPGRNGWFFDPRQPGEFKNAIASALDSSSATLTNMSNACRESTAEITAERSANLLCQAIRTILGRD